MKRNRLVVAGLGLAAASLAILTISFKSRVESRYRPSAELELTTTDGDAEDAHGAAAWLFNVMKNQNTGTIDMNEVIDVANRAHNAQSNAQRSSNNMQTASASWTELGPDNVGGRTRAILFDKLDATHQHMWAGGVGGGLFESTDAGNNWHKNNAFFSVPGVVITITTIAQGSDGALYVGTGEGDFYAPYGIGAGGLLGGGIYKSTDDGASWSLLSSTAPTASNSVSAAWAAVNKIVVDPSNPSIVYAGTNKGFKRSTDAGASWSSVSGPSVSISTTDVDIASNGTIIGVCGNKPWVSTDGGNSFTNHGLSANGWLTSTLSRAELDIAPSDPSIVYAFCAGSSASGNPLAGMLVSIDGGQNWNIVTGAGNAQFDPFNQSQGDYDNVVRVDPADPYHAIFGGVELWEYNLTNHTTGNVNGQWNRIALEFPAIAQNPWYVHSDKHAIEFMPGNPSTVYIGTDGGVFRTLDINATSPVYQQMNKGYNVTQCYGIAPDMFNADWALAGCQDNGSQYIDGNGNDAMDAVDIGSGDGGQVDISYLNPQGVFWTVYYGQCYRSNNRGSSSSTIYSDDRITASATFGGIGFANFVTPIRLWESTSDLHSGDTIRIINNTESATVAITDGSTQTFTGNLSQIGIVSNPLGTFVTTGAMVVCGSDTAIATAGTFAGDATGTINSTGAYSVTFNTAPAANRLVKIYYDLTFASGTIFTVQSNVAGRELYHTTPVTVNPGDTVKVQDVVQSHLAVGFSGNNGIWLLRRAVDFSVTPVNIKIGGSLSTPNAFTGETSQLCWSPDGDKLYVGTSEGNLFRFDNVGEVVDSANGDIEHKVSSTSTVVNPNSVVRCYKIGNFGRDITGIDVDPNNPSHVIVSFGNYNNTQYVMYSAGGDTATTAANATWADRTANLDNLGGCPVYGISFDKYTPNRVLACTEHGMYETNNFNVTTPTWAPAMTGLDNVACFSIRQQRWDPWNVVVTGTFIPNAGCFYIGTHGRGIWRDNSSWQQATGVNNPTNPGIDSHPVNNSDLKIFPNPAVDHATVNVDLPTNDDITLQIIDLNGRVVSTEVKQVSVKGINNVNFDTNNLDNAAYILLVTQNGKKVGTGRFLKMSY